MARSTDRKAEELAASRTLNPHPEAVTDEAFVSKEFFDARDIVQVKYEMVRRVEAEGTSVAASAGAFGLSRQSYYSAAAALAEGGLAGLLPAKPGPRGAHKLTDEVLDHLEMLRSADPSLRPAERGRGGHTLWGIGAPPLGGACPCPPGGRPEPEKWQLSELVVGERQRADPSTLVACYEQLRQAALAGRPDGWRLGHAVLAGRGMAAWMAAWAAAVPALPAGTSAPEVPYSSSISSPDHPTAPAASLSSLPCAGQIVAVLAQMALAHA